MHVGRIQNATRVLNAPRGWNRDENGPCGGLPIRDEQTTAGEGMVSAWFPTPEEIERIAAGVQSVIAYFNIGVRTVQPFAIRRNCAAIAQRVADKMPRVNFLYHAIPLLCKCPRGIARDG